MLLYTYEDKNIEKNDMLNSLINLGINKGDTIFVHTDISVFGKLACKDRKLFLSSMIEVLKEAVGEEGNIIMPTFSYSFCKGEIFDVQNTKGTVGTLNEFFRKQEDVIRTKHPIFSSSIWGKDAQPLADVDMDSFSDKSIFANLHKKKGKLLFLGATFHSCTYVHYIEQKHGIPYRYMKTFSGVIKDGINEWKEDVTFFVRYLDKDVVLDVSKLEEHLLKDGFMQEQMLGGGRMLSVSSEDMFNEVCKKLDDDIYYLLAHPV